MPPSRAFLIMPPAVHLATPRCMHYAYHPRTRARLRAIHACPAMMQSELRKVARKIRVDPPIILPSAARDGGSCLRLNVLHRTRHNHFSCPHMWVPRGWAAYVHHEEWASIVTLMSSRASTREVASIAAPFGSLCGGPGARGGIVASEGACGIEQGWGWNTHTMLRVEN
jgi:hypothetical protein